MKTVCTKCGEAEKIIKNGKSGENQKYKCKNCGNNFLGEVVEENSEKNAIQNAPNLEKSSNTSETKNEANKEEIKPTRVKSELLKQVNFRKHYRDLFAEPKYSKKYGFEFKSWNEYFQMRNALKK